MSIRSKNVYEPTAPDDGQRFLTTNYWPRGISKERAGTYLRALGPSRELLRAYRDGHVSWEEYEAQYHAEMRAEKPRAEIRRLADLAGHETVTVMCMCKDEDQCHRRLLRELIEAEMTVRA
jgi:uncharacterized protein YeaO (DUF488 family)